MKQLKILVISILLCNKTFSQNDCNINLSAFIGVEIYSGNDVLKLSNEGLLCSTLQKGWKIKAFTHLQLNQKKILNLQCFLLRNAYFSKDTTIDNPNIRVYDGSYTDIVVRKGWKNILQIRFIDNTEMCDIKLDSLINLANDIIPNKFKKTYSVKSTLACKAHK